MNDWERQHRQAQQYKEAYPPGTRLIIQMKCPRCKTEVKIDLSLRKGVAKYRQRYKEKRACKNGRYQYRHSDQNGQGR